MDKAKILRLCESLETDITALRMTERIEYDFYSTMIDAVQAISAEITAPPKTIGDRIRQKTDEELAEFIDIDDIEDICRTRCAKTGEARERCMCYGEQCVNNILQWLKQEVSEDASICGDS